MSACLDISLTFGTIYALGYTMVNKAWKITGESGSSALDSKQVFAESNSDGSNGDRKFEKISTNWYL